MDFPDLSCPVYLTEELMEKGTGTCGLVTAKLYRDT